MEVIVDNKEKALMFALCWAFVLGILVVMCIEIGGLVLAVCWIFTNTGSPNMEAAFWMAALIAIPIGYLMWSWITKDIAEEMETQEEERNSRGRLIYNGVKCRICGDVIESKHVHDFVSCSCGNVSVDGGLDYPRRVFKDDASYIELMKHEEEI